MSRTWEWGLPAVAVLLIVAGWFWESAVQPPMATAVAMRQMEIHRDGTGDRIAADGRVWWLIQHVPSGIATLTAAVLFVVWMRGSLAVAVRPVSGPNLEAIEQ